MPRSPRPAGRVETRPGRLRHRRDNSRRPRCTRRCRRENHCQLGFAIAGGVRAVISGGIRARFVAPGAGRSPVIPLGELFGSRVAFGRRLLAGSRPAGDHLSCGDKERWIKAPPAATPAPVPSLHPPGGSRRNSPSRAPTSTRQFPPAAGCSTLPEGEGCCRHITPLPAACVHRCLERGIGHDSSPRRRPGPRLLILAVRFLRDAVGRRWLAGVSPGR